jgi:hypothetical protein
VLLLDEGISGALPIAPRLTLWISSNARASPA